MRYEEILDRINQELELQGISQRDFGKMTGQAQANVNHLLNGSVVPGVKKLIGMLDVLGLELRIVKPRK